MNKTLLLTLTMSAILFSQESKLTKAPDLTFDLLGGKKATLSELVKNGPVVIDFWATWCEPCKKEMVHLEKIYKKYKDQGLTILAISQDSPRSLSKVKSYIRSKQYTFTVGLDPNQQVGMKLNAKVLPTTIIIDQNMNIMSTHQGYIPGDEKKLEEEIVALLENEE
ncbi:MAG: TlpA family protein disulfide reductase [Candidatus Marinimicrobia bacterium]|nr:TlpA family protein disulfide reductase [Candidatus Neomarinimicrobiota bacterium]